MDNRGPVGPALTALSADEKKFVRHFQRLMPVQQALILAIAQQLLDLAG